MLRANTVVYAPRPMMFSSVKLPALSVNAKYTTMASGTATNTMVMPVVMPGMESGTSTFATTWYTFAPRSCAASMTLLSILTMMVYSGSTI